METPTFEELLDELIALAALPAQAERCGERERYQKLVAESRQRVLDSYNTKPLFSKAWLERMTADDMPDINTIP